MEPLPCPLCNLAPHVAAEPLHKDGPASNFDYWLVSCRRSDDHSVEVIGPTKDEAIERWNTRAPVTRQMMCQRPGCVRIAGNINQFFCDEHA